MLRRVQPPGASCKIEKLCALLAENLFKLVQVNLKRDGASYTVQGLIAEVQKQAHTSVSEDELGAFVTLLKSDGSFVSCDGRLPLLMAFMCGDTPNITLEE